MLSSRPSGGCGCQHQAVPYWDEGRQFKPMTPQQGRTGSVTRRHLALPSTPTFKCSCARISPAFPLESFSRPPIGCSHGRFFVRNLDLSTNGAPIIPHLIGMTVSAVLCPYCLVVMTEKAETNSYLCEKCGHIAAPNKLDHACPCAKCADQIAKKS
jgi:hypothetical protein